MENIHKHIEDDYTKINDPMISPQSRRHYEDEVEQLVRYRDNHPGDDHDPNPLELFCDSNPEALECRIYED